MLVVLMVVSMSVLSAALISSVSSHRKESSGSREDISAFYVCEAGIGAAVMDLSSGGTGDVGSAQNPIAMGPAEYFVTATDLGGGMTSLQATGGDEHATLSAEVVVRQASTGLYRWGAFADEELHMDSNAMTDSYDSSLGDYASQAVNGSGSKVYANSAGSIGSNDNITMDSNTIVYGDANPGPSGAAILTGNAVITGTTTPSVSTVAFPAITVPSLTSAGSLPVTTDTTLPAGDYRYDDLNLDTGNTLTIEGPARLVCDNFLLDSNSKFLVDGSAGGVEIYVQDDFLMSSNTLVSSLAALPSEVSFFLLSDNIINPNVQVNLDADEVTFNSNAIMFGTVYAPNAWIEIDSNFELFGSLVAQRVDLDSNSKIHYDESLARLNGAGSSSYETLCWRILPRD